jgi:hypothetical protein
MPGVIDISEVAGVYAIVVKITSDSLDERNYNPR